MAQEPENAQSLPYGVYEPEGAPPNELAAGYFVARDAEQARFREMLAELAGGRGGFWGSLLGSGPKRPAKVTAKMQSRVVVISGPTGMGKTRLSLRLREISQKEKSFARRFRTTRLDWAEVRERDQRFAALQDGQPLPADALLDVLYTHFLRADFGTELASYKAAVEETRQLARQVVGAELEAVWEYRARALGKGLLGLAVEKPLLFFQDNFEALADLTHSLWGALLEESGPRLVWIICNSSEISNFAPEKISAPERYLALPLSRLTDAEMQRFFSTELGRYRTSSQTADPNESPEIRYRSPEQIARLQQSTGGLPLATRLAAFLVQTGLELDELPLASLDPLDGLVRALFEETLSAGHPDYLKLLGLALLRRTERGLWSAMLDLRQDMLPLNDVLSQLHTRYSFLLEPLRQMVLHPAIARSLRRWMLEPAQRLDEAGLARLNQRALVYLSERLDSWAVNFPTLKQRVQEIKWREWALDQVWHAFWLGTAEGWRETIPLFVAALAYQSPLMAEIVALIRYFAGLEILDQADLQRLEGLEQIKGGGSAGKKALAEIRAFEGQQNLFRQKMPRFANELTLILEQHL